MNETELTEEQKATMSSTDVANVLANMPKEMIISMLAKKQKEIDEYNALKKKEIEELLKKKDDEKLQIQASLEAEKHVLIEQKTKTEEELAKANKMLDTLKIHGVNISELPPISKVAELLGDDPAVLEASFEKSPKKAIEYIQVRAELRIDNLQKELIDAGVDVQGNSLQKTMTEYLEFFSRYPDPDHVDKEFPAEYKLKASEFKDYVKEQRKWQACNGEVANAQSAVWVGFIHYLIKTGDLDEETSEIATGEKDKKQQEMATKMEEMQKQIEKLMEKKEKEDMEDVASQQKVEREDLLKKADEIGKQAGAGDTDENPEEPEASENDKIVYEDGEESQGGRKKKRRF